MRLVDALEVPDLSEHSRDAQAQTRAVIDAVVARVAVGDNMLIYPSGRLQRGDREVVGAARSVYEIVARCPEVSIVLVRTRGVWGSRFSCAATGTLPDLTRQSWAAVGWALANCLFFIRAAGCIYRSSGCRGPVCRWRVAKRSTLFLSNGTTGMVANSQASSGIIAGWEPATGTLAASVSGWLR